VSEIEIGEHLSLVIVAAVAATMGGIGLLTGTDGVLSGGVVAVIASIAAFVAGKASVKE
jgi:hypothetical protein